MQKRQLIARKPTYQHGQLLDEDDFRAEQKFHSEARVRHARHLHGFGVADGLEVTLAGDMAISVSAGFAVDRKGREIELDRPETLELDLPAGALAWVTIGYREPPNKDHDGDHRIDCDAYLCVATDVEQDDVRLARVQLDERGRLTRDSISDLERDELRSRKDWITMPFHPSDIPMDQSNPQPPFRVGATQAQVEEKIDGKDNTSGGAGTMGIVLPPGVRRIHQFRVAGTRNDAKMTVKLYKGGFDPEAKEHLRDDVLTLEIKKGAYCETVEIPEAHRSMEDRYRTLAVEIRAEGFAMVSLVAIEVSY